MSTSTYPATLDSFTDPTATSPMNNPSHAGEHSLENDALLAIETTLGAPYVRLDSPGVLTTSLANSIPVSDAVTATTAIGATGVVYMVPILLPANLTFGHFVFVSGTTAASTPTHWWLALANSSRVMLAVTADQTTTAVAASSVFSVAVATIASGASTTFTTTYSGLHYVAVMFTATTIPTVPGVAPTLGVTTAAGVGVATGSSATTGQTIAPTFPTTFGAITAAQVRVYVELAS